jgi:3-mercaptopyruvate sulfurtransferase SseA
MITYLCISRISSNRYLDSSLLLREENHLHIVCRFDGVAPEPREGVRSGHIPGTKCVPFLEMFDDAPMLLPADEIRKKFEQAGISLDRPIVVTCGSGVTACILALV